MSAITERRDMGLHEVPLSVSLLGFGIGTMLASVCFRWLIFSLSGPCELLFLLLDLSSSECDVVSLYVLCCSVNGSVCFVCCLFDSVCELFGETIRNVFGCSCHFVVECYGSVSWLNGLPLPFRLPTSTGPSTNP